MKSKAYILIGLVFAVLLVTSAVADQKTTSKEEKKANANPKEEVAVPKDTKNVEEVEVADTNGWGGGGWGGGRGGGGWGGGRCCGRYGTDNVEAADAEANRFGRRPRFGGRRRGRGGGLEPAEEADANYYGGGRGGGGWGHGGGHGGGWGPAEEEADANYGGGGGGWGRGGGGW